MSLNIYRYHDPAEYLRALWATKKARNRRLSIRGWAKQMELRHPSSLEHFLSGRRKIKPNMVNALIRGTKLTANEKTYFIKLVDLINSKTEAERNRHQEELSKLQKYADCTELERDSFRLISDWYHFAIAAMTQLKGFRADPKWIADQLIGDITPGETEAALKRLLDVGMIAEVDGTLRLTSNRTTFWTTVPDLETLVLEHQQQVLRVAADEIVKPELASIVESSFMTIDSKRLPEATVLIREFRANLAKLVEREPGDSTYALAVQFFPVIKP